jgi:hypothetical protein
MEPLTQLELDEILDPYADVDDDNLDPDDGTWAMEQIVSKFTLAELAEKIGISLEALIERVLIQPMGSFDHDLQASYDAAFLYTDPDMFGAADEEARAQTVREADETVRRGRPNKAWEAYKTGLAVWGGTGGSASSAMAPTVEVIDLTKPPVVPVTKSKVVKEKAKKPASKKAPKRAPKAKVKARR